MSEKQKGIQSGKKGLRSRMAGAKRLKYGSFLAITTAAVIVAVIVLNILVGVLADRFNLKLDFTADNKFSISQKSRDFVKSLSAPVTIYVLRSEKDMYSPSYLAPIKGMLEDFAETSDKITLEYIDLEKNPGFKSQYPDQSLETNDVLVVSQGRQYKSALTSMVYPQAANTQQQTQQTVSDTEAILTSAVMAVTSTDRPGVVFLSGHGETVTGLDKFKLLLEQNVYEVKTQNVVTEQLDQKAKILVLLAPSTDYTKEELQKIDSFLINGDQYGRNLLYFAHPDAPSLPNLEAYLTEWGISVGKGLLYETDSARYTSSGNYFMMADYTNIDLAGDLEKNGIKTMTTYSRPLTMLFEEKGFIKTTALLSTASSAALNNNEDPLKHKIPSDSDARGVYPVMARAEKTFTAADAITTYSSNVIVSGSMLMLRDEDIASTALGNAGFIAQLFNDLSGKEGGVNILPKVLYANDLSLSQSQLTGIGVFFMAIVPIAVLVAGTVIWLRRRRL